MSDKDFEAAQEDCRTYNRMGGLTDEVIRDIAHDHSVSYERLKAEWNA